MVVSITWFTIGYKWFDSIRFTILATRIVLYCFCIWIASWIVRIARESWSLSESSDSWKNGSHPKKTFIFCEILCKNGGKQLICSPQEAISKEQSYLLCVRQSTCLLPPFLRPTSPLGGVGSQGCTAVLHLLFHSWFHWLVVSWEEGWPDSHT